MESTKLPLCFLNTPVSEDQIIFENPFVVDMARGEIIAPECLVIDKGRITHLGGRVDDDAPHIKMDGKFIIPGLWDMHVHTLSNAEFAFPSFLAFGVTGVRDMGSDLTNTLEWRFSPNLKPRLSYAGPILDGFMPFPLSRLFAETGQDVQIQISSILRAGADLVKVHNMLPRDAYFAAAERCKKEGLSLCGHVPFSVSAFEAIEAGQKTIEHMHGIPTAVSKDEARLRQELQKVKMGGAESLELDCQACISRDEDKLKRLVGAIKSAGVYVTPTLIAAQSVCSSNWDADNPLLDRYPAHVRRSIRQRNDLLNVVPQMQQMVTQARKFLENSKELAGALYQAGVPLLAGTDSMFMPGILETMVFYGKGVHDELELLVESGLSPFEALKTATTHAVACLGIADHLGSIEPGKLADLVILSANPLENITNIRSIEAVVLGGKYLNQNALQAL